MADNFNITKPSGLDEDDPLWQYFSQLQSQKQSPVNVRDIDRDVRRSYTEQNAMNEFIPAFARAGTSFGAVGGMVPKTALDYEVEDPRKAALRERSFEDKDDYRRQMLYQNLLTAMSGKIAAKDRASADAERLAQSAEIQRKKMEQEAALAAEKLRLQKEREDAERAAKTQGAEAERAFRAQQAEADRALRKQIADQMAAQRKDQLNIKLQQQKEKSQQTKDPNQEQGSYAIFGKQMLDAENELKAVESKGYDPAERWAAVRKLPGIYTFAANQNDRAYEAAKRKFIGAVLRKQSGAAISDTEFRREEEKYFPQAGDGAEVMAQKRAARIAIAKNFMSLGSKAASGMKSADEFRPKQSGDPVKAKAILDNMMKNPALLKSQNPKDIKARQYIIDSGLEKELREAQRNAGR